MKCFDVCVHASLVKRETASTHAHVVKQSAAREEDAKANIESFYENSSSVPRVPA